MPVIYGINPILEQLAAGADQIEHIFIARGSSKGQLGRITRLARESGIIITFVEKKALTRMADGGVHQGVVAEVGEYLYRSLEQIISGLSSPARVVALDGVQDPRNLGSIVRTAVCAGVHGIVIPSRNAAAMTAAAIKASAGAAATAAVTRVKNLGHALQRLKKAGLWLVAVDERGERDVRSLDSDMDYALVFGGEGKGIRRLLRERCDLSAHIPMVGAIDSLNVSVAVGITLFSLLPMTG